MIKKYISENVIPVVCVNVPLAAVKQTTVKVLNKRTLIPAIQKDRRVHLTTKSHVSPHQAAEAELNIMKQQDSQLSITPVNVPKEG